MSDLLQKLNPPQHKAVVTTEGPVLVLAGAGTGKTRVLTTRLAYILQSNLALPGNILSVTFTNKAAREMVERVEQLIGQSAAGLWLGTFHSLCGRILRRHAELVKLTPSFTVLDTDDQQRLLDQILKDKNIDTNRYPARQVVNLISKWKDEAKRPEDLTNTEAQTLGGYGKSVYETYQQRLKAVNATDFGDLLLECVHLFKTQPAILEQYQRQFKYVLVDEYQDTNVVQYLWLRLLTQLHKNICVVGDDDQSIYAWRGAQVGNILRFEKDYPGTTVVRLEQNYRSTGTILKAASTLISKNSERHSKTLWTEDGAGEKIEVQPCYDDREEARMIADDIEREAGRNKPYDHHAVLVRTAAQTRSIEERFVKMRIPYQMIGGLRFYDRKEIRDAIAYLRLIINPVDDLAFERIVNVPKRGVGNKSLQDLRDLSRQNSCSLFEAARMMTGEMPTNTLLDVEPDVSGSRTAGKLQSFVQLINALMTHTDTLRPDQFMEKILDDTGYLLMLQQDKDPAAKDRIENLKELVRALQEISDLDSFLEEVWLNADKEEASVDSVKIMTVHGAKGLEFDTVFLPGFEEGLFPHQRSLNEEGSKGLEEERRLAYVAITRAKRRLVISYAGSRRMYGSFQPSMPSRFLADVDQACVNLQPTLGMASGYRPSVGSTYEKRWAGGVKAKTPEPLLSLQPKPADENMGIGTRVFHQKFGYGLIKKLEGEGAQQRVIIDFEKAGQKKLVASMAKLEAVS
jgi:DNA helicase-2/ATP-dependent DNA helicase PcrA